MPRTIEQRIKALEEMVAEIRDVALLGKTPPPPGAEEYKRAIEAMADGRGTAMLSLFLKRGGIAPKAETIWPNAAVQRGGSNAPSRYRLRAGDRAVGAGRRRSANLPTVAIIPVMPPDNKGQRRVV